MKNPLKQIFNYLTITSGQGIFLFFLGAVGIVPFIWGCCASGCREFLSPSFWTMTSILSFEWISSPQKISFLCGLAILLLTFALYLGMMREPERRGFLIGISFSLLVHLVLWVCLGDLIVGHKPVKEEEVALNLQPKAPIIVNDYYFGDLPHDEVFETLPQPIDSEREEKETEKSEGEEVLTETPWKTKTEIVQALEGEFRDDLAQAEEKHDSLEEKAEADDGAASENARIKAGEFDEAKIAEAEMEKTDLESGTPETFIDLEKISQKVSSSGFIGSEGLSSDPLEKTHELRSDVPLPEKLNMREEALKKLEGRSEFSQKLKSEQLKKNRKVGEKDSRTSGTLPSPVTRDGQNVASGQARNWGETPSEEKSGGAGTALGEIRSGLGETRAPAAGAASLKMKKILEKDSPSKIAVSDAPENISGGQTVGAKAGDGERLEAVLSGAINGVSDAVLETAAVPDKIAGSNVLDPEKEGILKDLIVFQFETPSVPEMGMNLEVMKSRDFESNEVSEEIEQEDDETLSGPEIDLTSPIQEIMEAGTSFQPQMSLPYRQRKRQNHRKMIEEAGGNPISEQIVENGLQYLERTQFSDGHWSLNAVPQGKVEGESLRDAGLGVIHADTAATGLSLLAFLGAGYTHLEKDDVSDYSGTIENALNWLIKNQQSDGSLFRPRTDSDRYGRIYSHGIAAIALCEAYGMTHDPRLRGPAQKAIDFIVSAQTPQGGWRYTPEKNDGVWRGESDTSVSGWQAMALVSAKMAGLEVPDSVFTKLELWIQRAAVDGGAKFCYLPVENPKNEEMEKWKKASHAMTAEGLLMKLYLDHDQKEENFQRGIDYLMENLPSVTGARRDTYYWYYATQVLFHVHDARWMEWQKNLVSSLKKSQETEHPLFRGSWNPTLPAPDYWGQAAGRHYVTAMHLLILEVYYRHLPLFKELVSENVAGIQ
ncbi:MAG: hypothetical protein E7028_04085 [Planctomycetaceae bacterium]|nr:hypothetical protein [Planctomycetaceae bacterium]